jgi:hypothetical protein
MDGNQSSKLFLVVYHGPRHTTDVEAPLLTLSDPTDHFAVIP